MQPSTEDQGTDLWRQRRAGSVTGSRFCDVLAKPKRGTDELAARRNYRVQLITERLTGVAYENFSAKEVEHGKRNEPKANIAYELEHGLIVERSGFLPHPEIEWVGVSPDGVVYDSGEKGIIEIKCPYDPGVHLETWLRGRNALASVLLGEKLETPIPPEHIPQVQGNMWVCDAAFCDFISYDPRFPEHMQLYVHRVRRDEPYIANLKAEVLKFLDEVEDSVMKLLIPAGPAVVETNPSPEPVEA